MKKYIFSIIVLAFMAWNCKKETTKPIVTPEFVTPECLTKEQLPDKQMLIDKYGINGRVCGLLNDTIFKSYLSCYVNTKNKLLNFGINNYNSNNILIEDGSLAQIPAKKGIYNLKRKDNTLTRPSSSYYYWGNDDVIYNNFALDTLKSNTLEILRWDETNKEVVGVFNVHYVESQFYETPGLAQWGIHLDFKDCYFRAKIK